MPKISELNAITSVANTDLLMVVHDPSGSPSTNKVTLTNFGTSITSALRYASNTLPGTIKVGDGLVISNGVLSANTLSILPTSNTNEGYILTWDEVTNTAIWQAYSGVVDYTVVNSANSYTVVEHDNIIFADPNSVSQDIRIILPDASSTPPAVTGKSYTVKNINPGDNYKVTVTTYSGVLSNSNYLENPVTGSFIVSYDIGNKGESHTWIFDGTTYRQLAELSSSPVFYATTDSFHQVVLINPSNSNAASGDWVAYNNQGNYVEGTGPFVDMGINSNTYSDTTYGNVWGPSDSYLYNYGGNLIVGPQTNHSIKFVAGNTNNKDVRLTINSTAVAANTDTAFIVPLVTKANNSVGTAGQIAWDSNNIYICVGTNSWKKASLTDF